MHAIDTVSVARRYGVEVIDRPESGKPAAHERRRQDRRRKRPHLPGCRHHRSAGWDPSRPGHGWMRIRHRSPSCPRRRVNTHGRAWPVRGYFAINERLPVYRDGLFGRGMITLSPSGRARFGEFPAMIADDLFVDSQFTAAEKAEANEVDVVVDAPYTTRDLMNRLVRVRRGNAEMRAAAATGTIAPRRATIRSVGLAARRRAAPALWSAAVRTSRSPCWPRAGTPLPHRRPRRGLERHQHGRDRAPLLAHGVNDDRHLLPWHRGMRREREAGRAGTGCESPLPAHPRRDRHAPTFVSASTMATSRMSRSRSLRCGPRADGPSSRSPDAWTIRPV